MTPPGMSNPLPNADTQTADGPHQRGAGPLREVSPGWVAAAWVAAVVALLVQQWLEPFTASSHMGLFTNGGDLDIYRHGGLQVLHGDPLYAEPIPPGGWFTYPPFAAVGFIPLALLTFPVAQVVWMLASFVALTATIWRCATVLGYRRHWQVGLLSAAMAVVAVDIEAVRGTLWQGQVNLVLMAIIVWDLTRPRGARLRGWAVGLAVGIKLTAIVFVPYLLITRQWRAAATATATALTTVLLTWCLLPDDSTQYWFQAVFDTDRIGPLTHPGNFSIGGIVATLSEPAPMPAVWWLLGVAVAAALGYYAAYRAERAGHRLVAITVIGLLSCTVPPLAWGHHWVWVVPLLAVTVDRIVRSAGPIRWGWITGTAAICLVVLMWFSAWLYRAALRLNGAYPTYVDALDAAIAQTSRVDKLIAVGAHPLLFLCVALSVAVVAKPRQPLVTTATDPPTV
jgi:alpha-1,2-mannosyltransferase